MFGVEADDTEESVAVADSVEASVPSLLTFSSTKAKACAAEGFGEFVHFAADGLVDDAGVDLRGGEFCVAEHLAYRFD